MNARRHTLLVVDDESDVLESLRHLFHRSYRVLTAGSGDQALELLNKNDVHLILSDQRMPGMSGDVFLSHARRLQPDAIRMLFTGYADIQAVINAVNEGQHLPLHPQALGRRSSSRASSARRPSSTSCSPSGSG